MANVLESLTNVLRTLANHSEIQKQAYPQVFHDIYYGVLTIFTTDLTDLTDRVLQGVRQKPDKPLGEDGGQCPDVMLPLWSYKSELLTSKPKAYHHLPCRRSPSSPRR